MTATIIKEFGDLETNILPSDVHNAVLIILNGSKNYHAILMKTENGFEFRGTIFSICGDAFIDNGISPWLINGTRGDTLLEFIKCRWRQYRGGWRSSPPYVPEIIIIRDPVDIASVVDEYKILNTYFIRCIESKFITEKSVIPSSHRTCGLAFVGSSVT